MSSVLHDRGSILNMTHSSSALSPLFFRPSDFWRQVPFDEDQFAMTPNLENVTTLDHVTLDKPSPLATKLKEQKEASAAAQAAQAAAAGSAATGGAPSSSSGSGAAVGSKGSTASDAGGGSAALAAKAAVSKFAQPQMKMGNNRVQANEQALIHFRKNWDVKWDGITYRVTSDKASESSKMSWFGR